MNRAKRYFINALILSGCTLLMRTVAVAFNAFCVNKVGSEGMGLFSLVMSVYTFAVTFADNLMVSQLGDAAVSGVYMGNQIQTFIQLFPSGFSGAILIIAAQYWGKREQDPIRLRRMAGIERCGIPLGSCLR